MINHRYLTSHQVDSLAGFGFLDGPVSRFLEVSQPLEPAGSSLGRLFSRWCLEFSLSLRKKEEKRHFKALIDLCVSQY